MSIFRCIMCLWVLALRVLTLTSICPLRPENSQEWANKTQKTASVLAQLVIRFWFKKNKKNDKKDKNQTRYRLRALFKVKTLSGKDSFDSMEIEHNCRPTGGPRYCFGNNNVKRSFPWVLQKQEKNSTPGIQTLAKNPNIAKKRQNAHNVLAQLVPQRSGMQKSNFILWS